MRAFKRPAIHISILLLGSVVMLGGRGVAASIERFSIVQGETTVGTIAATSAGVMVNVEYAVNENGRGPKHHEAIRIGSNSIPVEWTISGTSLMGGPVSEAYSW